MIIIQLMGGLGNQMQQYALYRKFIEMGTEAKIDTSWYDTKNQSRVLAKRVIELDRFEGVHYDTASTEEVTALIGGRSFFGKLRRKLNPQSVKWYHENTMYDPNLLEHKDMYLSGFYSNEYYYRDVVPLLKAEFAFTDIPKECQLIADKMDNNSVSVHLRRGDYLDPENQAIFGGISTDEYYDRAVRYILDKTSGNAYFYVFSDDTEYANEFINQIKEKYGVSGEALSVNQGDQSCYDIYLMTKCHHNICANSTFSFWGARLNEHPDRIAVRPTIQKTNQTYVKEDMDIWWPTWTFISPDGTLMNMN